jgi:hypothetical protein
MEDDVGSSRTSVLELTEILLSCEIGLRALVERAGDCRTAPDSVADDETEPGRKFSVV